MPLVSQNELERERQKLRHSVASALAQAQSAPSGKTFHEVLREQLEASGAQLELFQDLSPETPVASAEGRQSSAPPEYQLRVPPEASAPPAEALFAPAETHDAAAAEVVIEGALPRESGATVVEGHPAAPRASMSRRESGSRVNLHPLSRSTALVRVNGWERRREGQPDESFVPTEEVAVIDLDDLWTVIQPEAYFGAKGVDGVVQAQPPHLFSGDELELKEGLVSAEGGRVTPRSLDVIEPSRIEGDDDGFLIVDDALVDVALADFIGKLFLEHRNQHVRSLTPDQLRELIKSSMDQVSSDYDPGTLASFWRWAKLLYTLYGWGSTAMSLYHRPFLVRLVVRSAWSVCRWVVVLLI